MPQDHERHWLYTLEIRCLFLNTPNHKKVERIASNIYKDIDGEDLQSATHHNVLLGHIDNALAPSLDGAPAVLFVIADLDAAKADAIARRLATSIRAKASDAMTQWTITAHPDFDAAISPVAIALGVNESALLAPNSITVKGVDSDIASVVSTTSDMVNFHLLAATVGDPKLHLLEMEAFDDDLLDPGTPAPNIRFDPENYGVQIYGTYQTFIEEGFIRNLNLFLSTYEDIDDEHFADYANFIAGIVADHWPVVARAITKCEAMDEDDVESNILIDGELVADWSVGRYTNHTFGSSNAPAGHALHLNQLPRSNLQVSLLTLAIRHAEIHVLGTAFTSSCQAWQELIHDIADRIRTELRDLPKWRGIFAN